LFNIFSNRITDKFYAMVKLKEIVSVQIGFPFRSRLERDENGNVCVIQMKDIGEDGLFETEDLVRIQMSEVKERYLVRPQDIVMRTRGQITTAAEVNRDLGMALVSGPLFRIRVESDKVLPSYLVWYINQPAAQAYLASRAKGTSVQMISKRAVEEMEMPLPSLGDSARLWSWLDWPPGNRGCSSSWRKNGNSIWKPGCCSLPWGILKKEKVDERQGQADRNQCNGVGGM
jgi:hypothetical protein